MLGPSEATPSFASWTTKGEHRNPAVVLVSNNPYALDRPLAPGTRPRLDGGRLGVVVLDAPGTSLLPGRAGRRRPSRWMGRRRCTPVSTAKRSTSARRSTSRSCPRRSACGSPPATRVCPRRACFADSRRDRRIAVAADRYSGRSRTRRAFTCSFVGGRTLRNGPCLMPKRRWSTVVVASSSSSRRSRAPTRRIREERSCRPPPARRLPALARRPIPVTRVDVNRTCGCSSTSKKSADRRCLSRAEMPVSTLTASIVSSISGPATPDDVRAVEPAEAAAHGVQDPSARPRTRPSSGSDRPSTTQLSVAFR